MAAAFWSSLVPPQHTARVPPIACRPAAADDVAHGGRHAQPRAGQEAGRRLRHQHRGKLTAPTGACGSSPLTRCCVVHQQAQHRGRTAGATHARGSSSLACFLCCMQVLLMRCLLPNQMKWWQPGCWQWSAAKEGGTPEQHHPASDAAGGLRPLAGRRQGAAAAGRGCRREDAQQGRLSRCADY